MDRIAWKMLTGDRAKYLGLIFGVAFATTLMANQTSIFVGLMLRTAAQVLDVGDADLWVMDPKVIYADEVEPLTDTQLLRVRSVPGVDWAVPFYKGLAVMRAPDGQLQQVILLGLDDASLAGGPATMVRGTVADLRQPDAILIDQAGHRFVWQGAPLEPGRVVEIADRRAVVVGISDARAPFTTFPVVHAKYSDALRWGAQTRKQLSFVLAKVRPGEDPSAVAARIAAETGLRALTWQGFAWATVDYYLQRTGIPVNFGITIVLGLVIGIAVVGQTFYIFVLENLKQFGALKAIGVGNATILRMVLLQAFVVAFVGYGIGIGITALFFAVTSSSLPDLRGFFLPWQVMAGVAAAILVVIVLASFASIRRALALDPAVVFRG